jgi:hypothetical protein
MKKNILIIFLFPLFVFAQTPKPIFSKLIDYSNEKTPVHCGYKIVYGVLKFELQEDMENFKKGDVVFIIQQCPKEIMEMSVGEYRNNHFYFLSVGSETNKKYSEIGYSECKEFYPNDNPKKFWYGAVIKAQ